LPLLKSWVVFFSEGGVWSCDNGGGWWWVVVVVVVVVVGGGGGGLQLVRCVLGAFSSSFAEPGSWE